MQVVVLTQPDIAYFHLRPCHQILQPGTSTVPALTSGCYSPALPSLLPFLTFMQMGRCNSLAWCGPYPIMAPIHASILWFGLAVPGPPPQSQLIHLPSSQGAFPSLTNTQSRLKCSAVGATAHQETSPNSPTRPIPRPRSNVCQWVVGSYLA